MKKKRIFTKIAVIYSLATWLYYVVISLIAERLDYDCISRVELGSTAGIVCFVMFFLSICFKTVSLFFIKKRYCIIVGLSMYWSGLFNVILGSNVCAVLLCLALVPSFIMFIADAFRGRLNNAFVNVIVSFIIVVPMFFLVFIVSLYEIYETYDFHVSPDKAYVVEREITYDIYNETHEQHIVLRENKYINIGMLYLCTDGYAVHNDERYLSEEYRSPYVIEWEDNGTIKFDGELFYLTEIID